MASAKKSKSSPKTKPPAAKPAKKVAPKSAKKVAAKPAAAKPAKQAAKPGKLAAVVAAVKALIQPSEPKPKKGAVTKAKPAGDKPGLDVGSKAPSFKLKDQNGKELASASLAGSPYVLYFYPKDDTTGCTAEACGFRDSFRAFGSKKARIIGVSPDSEASHTKFVGKYGLPFTLLSDPEKVLANAYGVWVKKLNYGREYMGIQRSTFLVDGKGVVQKVWRNVKVDGHVAAVLDSVKSL